ncbi:hypothetical protein F5884DRAFT_71618 [Xylogone sp. PMI_703]|nr:hypothetical protein F5884DRAFT_71618 [Xylogone sp. PMI_703]
MQLSILLPVSLLFSYSAAQSVCGAQPVLEACLASTQAIAASCSTTDYQCLCEKWKVVLQCFEQCPNDSRQSGVLSSEETYCADMSVYATTTTTPISAKSTGAAKTTGSDATPTGNSDAGAVRTGGSSSTPTSSGAAVTQSSHPDAAAGLMVSAGGMMIAVAGFVGAFL